MIQPAGGYEHSAAIAQPELLAGRLALIDARLLGLIPYAELVEFDQSAAITHESPDGPVEDFTITLTQGRNSGRYYRSIELLIPFEDDGAQGRHRVVIQEGTASAPPQIDFITGSEVDPINVLAPLLAADEEMPLGVEELLLHAAGVIVDSADRSMGRFSFAWEQFEGLWGPIQLGFDEARVPKGVRLLYNSPEDRMQLTARRTLAANGLPPPEAEQIYSVSHLQVANDFSYERVVLAGEVQESAYYGEGQAQPLTAGRAQHIIDVLTTTIANARTRVGS